ncbi:MAG: group III truncated hemoglobin [Bacteroidota bacterium]|nr:group III truncated hemoglobin [Bacteroidota bacterium]
MKSDILTTDDVKLLVDSFYRKVTVNPVLGHIFTDVVKVDWNHHLPKMYAFWSTLLLGDMSYHGNPMQVHIDINKITPLGQKEFDEWIRLFTLTVEELFEGQGAVEAKARARSIAQVMMAKFGRPTI